ncbi:MAG: hypothetical protein ISS81_11045 [Candidatus Marinimicrobia bacterium]|nr:hypothetical protein [Candidatus Neomarinimicrobiota bacterium]
MKIYYRCIFPFIILLTITLFCSCSIFTESKPTAEDLANSGWTLFQNNNYEAALNKFLDAAYDEPDNEVGYHGCGWCYLLLNESTNAIENFSNAISKGNITNDPIAGLAAAYLAAEEYAQAIYKAKEVLQNNPNYYFEYEPLIDYQDMRLILAMAYYHEGQLGKAQEQVNFLDPSNKLNPDDPDTWVVNDVKQPSYAEALMALIDYLDVLYGM